MKATLVTAIASLLLAGAASAQVVIYEHDDFKGRSHLAGEATPNLAPLGFNDLVSSVEVRGGAWQFCEHEGYGGQCVVLNPGRYASLRAMGMNDRISSLRPAGAAAAGAAAAIELYEHDDFAGRVFRADGATPNLQPLGFNDVASSAVVRQGRWELCSDAEYRGRCITLEPGRYRRLRDKELNDRVSSLRPLGSTSAAPAGPAVATAGGAVIEYGPLNLRRVVYPNGCTVHFVGDRRREPPEPDCSSAQLTEADALIARQSGR